MHSPFLALRVRPANRTIRRVADDGSFPDCWLPDCRLLTAGC
ncbi:hypothetical protein AB0G35_19115 [Streptomyces sp. NPDC021749]